MAGLVAVRLNGVLRLHCVCSVEHVVRLQCSLPTWLPSSMTFKRLLITYRISRSKHPGAKIDSLSEMLNRLHINNIELSKFIKTMLLLNALPASLSQVTTIALETQSTMDLHFSGLRGDIITEYERKTLPSANKLSAVKCKGQDSSYRSQKCFQPLDQPDCAPAKGSSNKGKERSTEKLKRKCGSGINRKQKCEGEGHSHSHLASHATIKEDFPPLPQPTQTITIQPSRTELSTTTIASFSKDAVTYCKVEVNKPVETGSRKSIYPDIQKTCSFLDHMDVSYKTETFKTDYKVVNPPPVIASSSRVTLNPRPPTPEPLIWHSEDEDPLDKAIDDYFGSDDKSEF